MSFILYNDFTCQVDSLDLHCLCDTILRHRQQGNKNQERFGKVPPCPVLAFTFYFL